MEVEPMELAIAIIIVFTLTATLSYAQADVVTAEDNLIAKSLSRIKSLVISNSLQEVVLWKIEADERKSVNVKRLSTRLNFALMDAGLLTEHAIDLTEIGDRDELRRIASIYGIGAFVYGKRTVVEGGTIKVSFQLLDAGSLTLIWEGLINSEKPLPPELLLALYYGKWVSLGTGVTTGVGAITTLALGVDALVRSANAKSGSEQTRADKEATSYLDWSTGLGTASLVSSGVAVYLFLTDQEGAFYQGGASLPAGREREIGKGVGVFLWPQQGGVVAVGYLRF
jgi:hypothetical protein